MFTKTFVLRTTCSGFHQSFASPLLTFRALHGNHTVSTPFQTIVEEDTQKIVTLMSVQTLTFHETHCTPPFPPGNPNTIQYLIPVRATNVELLKQVKNWQSPCGTLDLFVQLIPRKRQKVKLILILAGKKTLQRQFASAQGKCVFRFPRRSALAYKLRARRSCRRGQSCAVKH